MFEHHRSRSASSELTSAYGTDSASWNKMTTSLRTILAPKQIERGGFLSAAGRLRPGILRFLVGATPQLLNISSEFPTPAFSQNGSYKCTSVIADRGTSLCEGPCQVHTRGAKKQQAGP